MATNLLELIQVVYPIRPLESRRMLELYQECAPRGILVRDLIHVAAMLANGINTIISTDGHFDQISEVKRLDPLQMFGQAD